MCLYVLVAVMEDYDGDTLFLILMVINFACCDLLCEWGPPVGLMRKLASVISSRASLIARLIKNPLAMWETWV